MSSYDVVIVGGGIHGVGAAQAAAAAGYRVLLLEKNALASGTSSRSSKLIHGGLRYLESGQFSLVRECLTERHILTRLAPELIRLEEFYIPVYASTSRSRLALRLGLSLYALLGGLQPSTRFSVLDPRQWPSLGGLQQQGLKAVYQYYDGRTDDVALTQAVMRSAVQLGAEFVIPAEFMCAQVEQDVVQVIYKENGIEKHCQAAALINAAGPWVNEVLEKISPSYPVLEVDLVQGAHLVLENMPLAHCFYLEAPQDKRAVFLMPWKNQTLLGTTETHFQGRPDTVAPQAHEQDYLLEVVQHYFPGNTPRVAAAFAGLRVLPSGKGRHFSKPRDTLLYQSHPRIINIYGGKMTTYRLAAERTVKKLHGVLPARTVRSLTANIMLSGD